MEFTMGEHLNADTLKHLCLTLSMSKKRYCLSLKTETPPFPTKAANVPIPHIIPQISITSSPFDFVSFLATSTLVPLRVTALTIKFVTLTTSDPPSAVQNPSTTNPFTRCPTSRNNKALISTTPSPIVNRMNGSVNSTSNGFRIALKKLSSNTTAINVPPLSHSIPGTIFVASITPSASTSQRKSNCVIGEFIA